MRTRRNTPLVSWALGLLTLAVLVLNLPENLDAVLGLWLLFAGLTAFALNFGVLLTSGEIAPAHVFSIMAFLTLGRSDHAGEALWAVAVGALVGSLIQVARADEWLPRRRLTVRSLGTVAETMAHLTLSLLVGGTVYVILGGRLPLGRLTASDAMPLLAFSGTYLLIYLLFFVLRVRLEGKAISGILSANWVTLIGVVLLPIPFGILGAAVATDLDNLSWGILITGLLLVVIGVYGLSRTQFYYRQQVAELSSLSVVSQALRTSLELDALLETIYVQVAHLLSVDNFIVALVNPSRGELYFPLAVRQGKHIDLPPREPGSNLIDHVIQHRAPLLIERDVAARARQMGLRPVEGAVYSWLGVPLLAPDRALGAISVFSSDPEHLLSAGDQRLLMNVAAQAAVTLENAQLYGQAQAHALQLATLNNISTLLTGTLAPERVINLVTSSAAAVSECDAVAVYLYQGSRLTLARNTGLSAAFSDDPPLPLIARTDVEPYRLSRQPLVVTDSHTDPQVDAARRHRMDIEGKRAWLELMLVSGDTPLGVIVVFYDYPRTFSGDAIELMRTFGVQAALAINNARLYTSTDTALDRRVHQLQALYDIGQELTSILNLQKIFDLVLSRAREGTNSDLSALLVGTDDNLGFQIVASQGYPPGAFDDPVAIASSITAAAYDTGRPILLPDVRENRSYLTLDPRMRSQMSIPIRREGETLGVITVESARLDAYGDDDVTFVSQLATQAAIAIDNARLFKRIAEGRDRLQVILDSMTEGVLLIDGEGVVALANPRIESLLGLRAAMLVGRLVDDLLQDTSYDFAALLGLSVVSLRELLADLRAGIYNAENAQGSYELAQPQHLYLKRNIAPVRDENGTLLGLLIVLIDETEQQELAHAREDLNRMIVHDLRSPLTAVTASLKLLNDVIPADNEFAPLVQRTTEASMRAVRKLLNLVDSLLDIAKMESGQMSLDCEPIHLNAVAGNVVLEMDSLARELDVNLAVDVAYDLPLLNIDGEKIERVLLNLVDNALKFTPAGGTVMIQAYPPGQGGAGDGRLRVQVSDTGPGVPDEYKARLFDRFVQIDGLRGRRRGTGLGLTFCRLAVEAHGGRIWIEDNPAGGSIFAFTVPIAEVPPQADEDLFPTADDGDISGPLL